VQGGFTGTGNINADPLFCNAGGGILRLQDTSPCLDAGADSEVPDDRADVNDNSDAEEPLPWDLIRSARQADALAGAALVDMGAYENPHDPECPWDLDRDGWVGVQDLAILLNCYGALDCETLAVPGLDLSCCAADFTCDNVIGTEDLAIMLGAYGEPCGGEGLQGGGESAASSASGPFDDEFIAWALQASREELLAWFEEFQAGQ
jgi:hypothetical protein